MNIGPNEYPVFREWFALMSPLVFNSKQYPPEHAPLAMLDDLAQKSPSKARKGLSMAIGDLIELTDSWPNEALAAADKELIEAGVPSLSAVRRRFSRSINAIVRRGQIKTEQEYHAVRNVVEAADEDGLWHLLADYENRNIP